MRGKKGIPHQDPNDPPRKRANKVRGHGDYESDRPAVVGAMSRETKKVHLRVVRDSSATSLMPAVEEETKPGTHVMTDEWRSYSQVSKIERSHSTVCHGQREWARDDDGDGINEVHTNSIEGFWTALRNFLRPFRGVSKKYLQGYISVVEWCWNRKDLKNADLFSIIKNAPEGDLTFEPG